MNNYIPTYIYKDIYEINFQDLYNNGKRIIFFDIDNTLLPYTKEFCDEKLIELNIKLRNIGYKIYFISNNNDKRIKKVSKDFLIDGYEIRCNKPSSKKVLKFIKNNNLNVVDIIFVGDQLLTDILCSNRCSIDSILVKSIDRSSEHWYTKINRLRERFVLNKIKQNNINKYNKIKEIYKNE